MLYLDIKNKEEFLVEEHNKFRSEVSPSAANMRRLSWDPNLATIAATHSKYGLITAAPSALITFLKKSYCANTCSKKRIVCIVL